jgi:hypothetical protein
MSRAAKEIELGDRSENLGVQMVREVVSKINDVAGAGTTMGALWEAADPCKIPAFPGGVDSEATPLGASRGWQALRRGRGIAEPCID